MRDIEKELELIFSGTIFADEVDSIDEVITEDKIRYGKLRIQMQEELRERLKEKKQLRVYLGIDPTAKELHIGHFVPVLKLKQFQELGHHIIFLIGDYTGQIGDPSGQKKERPFFTHEELLENAKGYTDQAFKLLDPQKTEIRYNGEWLSKLTFKDIIELASIFPLKQIISRRDFQQRLERGESLRFHEALYALMQGYDAYILECDVQVGGYDQHFNMLAGRDIQTYFGQKPHIMITLPLLMGTDSRKMSKSYKNTINITDPPEDMYGKCMRISDELIIHYLELATTLPLETKKELKEMLKNRTIHPMEAKKIVAFNIVKQFWGEEGARAGEEYFKRTIQEKEFPEEVPEVELRIDEEKIWLPQALKRVGLLQSSSEAKRLLAQGGIYINGERISEEDTYLIKGKSYLIRVGKRKFANIKVI